MKKTLTFATPIKNGLRKKIKVLTTMSERLLGSQPNHLQKYTGFLIEILVKFFESLEATTA